MSYCCVVCGDVTDWDELLGSDPVCLGCWDGLIEIGGLGGVGELVSPLGYRERRKQYNHEYYQANRYRWKEYAAKYYREHRGEVVVRMRLYRQMLRSVVELQPGQ